MLALRYLVDIVVYCVVLCTLICHEEHLVAAVFEVDDARLQAEGLHGTHGAQALGLALREHGLHHGVLVVFNGCWVSGRRVTAACRVLLVKEGLVVGRERG